MEKIVTHFMRTGVKPEQIGIITPYEGQRAHVLSVMQRSGSLASSLYAEVSHEGALPLCEVLLVRPDIATAQCLVALVLASLASAVQRPRIVNKHCRQSCSRSCKHDTGVPVLRLGVRAGGSEQR